MRSIIIVLLLVPSLRAQYYYDREIIKVTKVTNAEYVYPEVPLTLVKTYQILPHPVAAQATEARGAVVSGPIAAPQRVVPTEQQIVQAKQNAVYLTPAYAIYYSVPVYTQIYRARCMYYRK